MIKKVKTMLLKIFLVNIGLFIAGTGNSFFFATRLGTSPMATTADGLHKTFNISHGAGMIIMNTVFLIILFFIARKYIGIGTVCATFFLGVYIDISGKFISFLGIADSSLFERILFALLGSALMGIGLGFYIVVEIGYGTLEALVDIIYRKINKKVKFPYKFAKISFDFILAGIGYLLGGTIGLGTIISVFLTGVIMQSSIECTKKLFSKIKFLNDDKINLKFK